MRQITKAINFIRKINNAIGSGLALSVGALTLIVLLEIILRYFLNSPTVWTFEVSVWLFGIPALLGGAYVMTHRGHVNLDIIHRRFPPRIKAGVDLITSLLFFSFTLILLWQGTRYATHAIVKMEKSWSLWGPYIWPVKVMIPIAFFLVILEGLAQFVENMYLAVTGRKLQ